MFKKISWLLLLLPLTKSYALHIIPEQAEKSNNNANVITNIESLSEEQIISPRKSDDFFRQCYINVPPQITFFSTRTIEQMPVNVDALSLTASQTQFTYHDDVNLQQGDKHIFADKMTYFINEDKAIAEGNVNFVNGQVTFNSDKIETNLSTEETSIYQASYQFHGRGARGSAAYVYGNGEESYELTSSTYTACPPNDTTWSLNATTVYIDNVKQIGSAYNAILRIKDVPVFYLPYISYPLSDRRKSGLLFPTYEYSDTDGFTFTQSLYLNIRENMDATITTDYIQNRGTKIAGEYRYLFNIGEGSVQAEYLSDDKIRQYDRYLYHWDHNITFAQNWTFNAEYSKVSDEYYFSDIDTPYGNRSDNQLLQTAKLSYRQENWNSELEVRYFQILSDEDDSDDDIPHKVLPKLSFSAFQPLNWKSLQLDWYSEITRFDHSDSSVYTGTRIHIEPQLSLPLYYNSMFINTELKYMLSFYEQSLPDVNKESWYSELEQSTSRYLPSFKINAGINFERSLSFLNKSYRQTLVPKIQYLYVPYQDQSMIGTYDTTSLQQDYYGLFRDNRYSGDDRIADANQITLGISSSFLNNQGKERMRLAIGQNYYLESSRIDLPDDDDDDDDSDDDSRSSVIGEFDMNFNNNYFFHAGLNWDSDNNLIKRANSTFEKRWLYNTFAQISYRYLAASEDSEFYIDDDEIVNQLGSKVNWSINSQWSAFASYYHDIEYNNAFESIIGVQYQSCCWSIGLTYDQHMLAYYDDLVDISEARETEQSLQLNIELTGLGGTGVSVGDQGLFDYGRPFYLQ